MVSRVKKSVASSPAAWARKNVRQLVSARRGAGPRCAAARIRRIVVAPRRCPSPASFALDAAVAPGRILLREAQHQLADLVTDRWAARPVRIGPFFLDHVAVPGQQRGGGNDPMPVQLTRESAGQGGQECSIRPGQAGSDLTAQHRYFVAQDQNLDVLGGGAAGEQPEPAEHRDRDQIQQSKRHGVRSCHAHVE
jgi:hypothetical protein